MKTNLSNSQNLDVWRLRVAHAFQELVRSKKEENKASFNAQLLKILPEVKAYINGRLNAAIKKGHFSKNKYKADGFINQLFIEVYDHIDEVKEEKDFYLWLFKKTNELLEDTIVEEAFDDFFFKNIDAYSKPEWDAMEEEFSTDGDGDLVILEELDDTSYNHNDYTLDDVFVEDHRKALIEKIDKNLNKEAIDRHVQMVLHNLPLPMQTVFELSTKQHLDVPEIAQVRNCTVKEVENLIQDARKALQISLFNRYPSR